MLLLIWILNFAISWLNAWGCGKTWNETKHNGGIPHFMNWMGAIMSASGFTWCYMVIAAFAGSVIPFEQDDGTSAPLLTAVQVQAFCDLGYLMIIVPIIGSGLAITIHSWGVFYRRRSLGDGAVAGWNTFAQIYNIASAFQHVPQASKGVLGFFGDSDEKGKGLVLLLAVLAVAGGILTTSMIIRGTARRTAFNRLHSTPRPEGVDEEDDYRPNYAYARRRRGF